MFVSCTRYSRGLTRWGEFLGRCRRRPCRRCPPCGPVFLRCLTAARMQVIQIKMGLMVHTGAAKVRTEDGNFHKVKNQVEAKSKSSTDSISIPKPQCRLHLVNRKSKSPSNNQTQKQMQSRSQSQAQSQFHFNLKVNIIRTFK